MLEKRWGLIIIITNYFQIKNFYKNDKIDGLGFGGLTSVEAGRAFACFLASGVAKKLKMG